MVFAKLKLKYYLGFDTITLIKIEKRGNSSLAVQVSLQLDEKFQKYHIDITVHSQCLKIIVKVSFDNASETSYIYILCGQKFIKNAKNW